MAEKARNPELKMAFEEHLRQTEEHVRRLEDIAQELAFKPRGKKCVGMEGLIEEGQTDEKLTGIAEGMVNVEAMTGGDGQRRR